MSIQEQPVAAGSVLALQRELGCCQLQRVRSSVVRALVPTAQPVVAGLRVGVFFLPRSLCLVPFGPPPTSAPRPRLSHFGYKSPQLGFLSTNAPVCAAVNFRPQWVLPSGTAGKLMS